MAKPLTILSGLYLSLIIPASLTPRSSGLLEIDLFTDPNMARQQPACGSCHTNTLGHLNGLQVSHVGSKRSLSMGETITMTTSSTGGVPGTMGGFLAEASAGQFTPTGPGTKILQSGAFISHSEMGNNKRSWSYDYTAPQTPGVVSTWAVVNTADGSNTNMGEIWGVFGPDAGAQLGTPVRLYVNNIGVTDIGPGCQDNFGNIPVIGCDEIPSVGNVNFHFDIVNAPPGALSVLFYGRPSAPIPLDFIGMTGCSLYMVVVLGSRNFLTSGGSGALADGVGIAPLGIPPSPSLVGVGIHAQAMMINGGNALGVISTNGVRFVIQ